MYSGLVSRQCRRTCDRYSFFDQKIAIEKLTGLRLVAEHLELSDEADLVDSEPHHFKHAVSSLEKFDCTICNFKIDNALDMTMPTNMDQLLSCVTRVRESHRWAILLYSGGKFAGGVFDGQNELVHKTLQHYTVRAKQGGSQSGYDASSGGIGGCKSAGSSLRRYGEIAIRNEISDLLHNKWRLYLQSCQFIFLWSPKVHRNIFFQVPSPHKNTLLETDIPADPQASQACQVQMGMISDDPRLRNISCRLKHITYKHVQELHKELSTFDVYDNDAKLDLIDKSDRKQWQTLTANGNETLWETKSGRFIYGSPNLILQKQWHALSSDTSSQSSDDITEVDEDSEDDRSDAGEMTSSSKPRDQIANDDHDELEDLHTTYENWHRRVRVAIASGDCLVLKDLLPTHSTNLQSTEAHDTSQSSTDIPPHDIAVKLLNHPLSDGRTLLHIGVEVQSSAELIQLLLDCGCDPSVGDANQLTPYELVIKLGNKKHLAQEFRRFWHLNPDRYDYKKAKIPTPLNPVQEAARIERERERMRRQKQRQKEKRTIQRAENEQKQRELEEQTRFLALPDREKRALAAERRILASKNEDQSMQVFSRCFQCGCDMSGKVPFTYMDFNFCSPACLKNHRLGTKK